MEVSVTVSVPAVEKLVDYAASGIGSVAGTFLAPWRAHRNANANLITAKGTAAEQKILAEGQATATEIITTAQTKARSLFDSSDASIQGTIDFGSSVRQRLQFQEEKRQRNIESVVTRAALNLAGKVVDDHEPDPDWTARFFNDVQDVSSEDLQKLWANILAGEIVKPGNTSIKTLGILKNLDKSIAELFARFCSLCVSIRLDENHFIDARVPSLGGNAGQNSLSEYGINFDQLNLLNEHGLIISDYNSWNDYGLCIGIQTGAEKTSVLRVPFRFQNQHWVLVSTAARKPNQEFRLSGVALSRSGRELSRVVDLASADAYAKGLRNYFASQGLLMVNVEVGPSTAPST